MTARGMHNKLLELRESKDVAQFHWSGLHKTTGIIYSISIDTVSITQLNDIAEQDGIITIPSAQITHIIEDSQEIKQIKQYLLQKSFKL